MYLCSRVIEHAVWHSVHFLTQIIQCTSWHKLFIWCTSWHELFLFDIAADASIASHLGNSHEHFPSYIVRLLQPVSTCQPVSNCPLSVCHMQSMPQFQHRLGSAQLGRMCCAVGDLFAKCQRSVSEVIKTREVLKNGEVSALLVRIVSRHVQDSLVSVSTIIGSRQRSLFEQCLDMSNTRLYRFPL